LKCYYNFVVVVGFFRFMRKDVTVLGKFSLNLTNIPITNSNEDSAKEATENSENSVNSIPSKSFVELFNKYYQEFCTMVRFFLFIYSNYYSFLFIFFYLKSYLFPLTIDNLNKLNLIPNKDYNKNKLITGILQLPDKFSLIIDETLLNTGELKEKGLINFNSIKDVIKWQRLNYDFSYHTQEFQTDLRVLVFSEAKSIIPVI
jgi:hypothetical protein